MLELRIILRMLELKVTNRENLWVVSELNIIDYQILKWSLSDQSITFDVHLQVYNKLPISRCKLEIKKS